MKITEETLLKIREALPHGYSEEIQKDLLKKKGKTYSLSHIRKGLMYKHKSIVIIESAIRVLAKIEKDRQKVISPFLKK